MEFTFDNNIPIYIQLLEYLKIYLISGVFKSGDRLPSVREFAVTFKVNPNTMQKALAELEEMKLIYTERTNGKYVTKNTKIIEKLKDELKKAQEFNKKKDVSDTVDNEDEKAVEDIVRSFM